MGAVLRRDIPLLAAYPTQGGSELVAYARRTQNELLGSALKSDIAQPDFMVLLEAAIKAATIVASMQKLGGDLDRLGLSFREYGSISPDKRTKRPLNEIEGEIKTMLSELSSPRQDAVHVLPTTARESAARSLHCVQAASKLLRLRVKTARRYSRLSSLKS